MNGVIERVDFDLRVLEALREIEGILWELGRVPDAVPPAKRPNRPYGIVYTIPWDHYTGAPEAPERDAPLAYQVTMVGDTHEQAVYAMDLVRVKLLGIGPSGYLTDLDVTGVSCMGRMGVSPGGTSADASLLSVVERFVFYCQSTT